MNAHTGTPSPTLESIIEALRRADQNLNVDLVLKLHIDGSGRILNNRTDDEIFGFDSLDELRAWLLPTSDDLIERLHRVPRGKVPIISDACRLGLHRQCIQGPGKPCPCPCHLHRPGGEAA